MIFDRLCLENIGVFRDRQEMELAPPTPDQPVVLIGGLNGAGKTTIRDAIYLALYGAFALEFRGTRNYDSYLRSLTHRGTPDPESVVELDFRVQRDGAMHTYSLRRSWITSSARTQERFAVDVDGKRDRMLAAMWPEHMETILPRGVADLFFFDGEKIEALADVERSRGVLSAGLTSLLGLDLIERLDADLAVVRRRHKVRAVPRDLQPRVEAARQEVTAARLEEETQVQVVAAANDSFERAKKQHAELVETFRSAGGEVLDQSTQIEERLHELRSDVERLDEELRLMVGGALPFLFVSDQLQALAKRAASETEASREQIVLQEVRKRDRSLTEHLKRLGVEAGTLDSVRDFLRRDRDGRRGRAACEQITGLRSPAGPDFLAGQVLPDMRQSARAVLARRSQILEAVEEAERLLAAVPDPDAVASLRRQRDNAWADLLSAQARLESAQDQMAALGNIRGRKERVYEHVLDEAAHVGLAADDDRRLTDHIDKVRRTLSTLRVATTQRHVDRVAEFVLEALTQLLRKERLITEVIISPDDCALELFDPTGEAIPADQLSAGERQLLAVAILWGLARASGQPLPVVIDTPLGRLDSSHRAHLLERYFPLASHQVILLSTDTEIDEAAHALLEPYVGHSYVVRFDGSTNASNVHSGYFW
jgi:DNA sulfur modification protein DndD